MPRTRSSRRRCAAVIGMIVGVVLLMTGLVAKIIPISVLGFLMMLAAAFFAVTSYRGLNSAARLGVVDGGGAVRRPQQPAARRPRDHRGLMERLEERWNRRRDENGR
jgi:hypothetical protein